MQNETPRVETHILVVDDEPMVAGSVERTLRAHGFQVTVANSGGDGLSAARRHVPDLVVLDVVMPGMDGLEVCRQLRKDPLLGDVPVLFLTARDKREDRVLGLRAGADDYLAKPFDIDELVLRITAILRRRAPRLVAEPPAAQLAVRDLVLDCKAFTVATPRGEASLTPVQFDLLYFLMSHPGEVFSPAKLLHDVWNYPFDAGSRDLVRVHIKNLRDKIEADPSHPQYITTITGHGYTIQP